MSEAAGSEGAAAEVDRQVTRRAAARRGRLPSPLSSGRKAAGERRIRLCVTDALSAHNGAAP